MTTATKTRNVTANRLETIKFDLSRCVGSYVAINGQRWYVGNIFDNAGGRKTVHVGGMMLVCHGGIRGNEYKTFLV